jgi:penicillin-binding protein 1A
MLHASLVTRHPVWLVLGVLVAGVAALLIAAWTASPNAAGLEQRVHARLSGTGGRPVGLSSVARGLRDAVVATEDERFYQHQGIDVIGILRALPYDLVHLSFAQGASTITEQVAKLLYLHGSDHSPWGKLEDAAVALKLEGRYNKPQILTAYLNSAYFGQGAYGIWAASERYFGVAPRRLDVSQASMLAGLIQAPSAYDPYRAPSVARDRQIEVLRAMVGDGFLTESQGVTALARPLRLRGGPTLPPRRGVELSPGPAFVWSELAFGACIVLLASVALIASRLPRFRVGSAIVAVRIASVALVVLGLALIVRSFRTA